MKQCRPRTEQIDLSPQQNKLLDGIIELLLAGLLVFMPLSFGAVHAWSQQIVVVLSSVIALCFALKLLSSRQITLVRSWTYLPIILFLLFILFQLIPLPTSLVGFISPNTVQLKTQLLAESHYFNALPRFMNLTFYPYATKHQLRLLLGGIAVYIVVLNVFRTDRQIKRLLICIAAIGAIVAVIALLQNLFGNGKIYGLVAIRQGQAHNGTFVNHSHFSQFINLSIAAALAIVIVKLQERFNNTTAVSTPDLLEYLGCKESRLLWLMAAIIVLGISTIFTSLSRSGIISMLAAASLTTVVIIRHKQLKSHAWIIGLIALAAFVCILYTGFDAVYERLATLRNFSSGYSTRWRILKDLTVLFRQFWPVGTGLGTHLVVYPMFSHCNVRAIATHAENEYAQLFEETGIVGLAIVAMFAFIICRHYMRHVKKCTGIQYAAYGIGFGLAAVAVQSIADFGQHLPANGFLSAVFCGLLVSLSNLNRNQKTYSTKPISVRLAIFVGISAVSIWAVAGANNSRIAEAHWKKAIKIEQQLVKQNWKGSDGQFDELITQATQAHRAEPQNIEYRYWWNSYRWKSISRQTEPDSGAVIIPEESMAVVCDIIDNLRDSHALCPVYGYAYCLRGQLELFILEDASGTDRIRMSFKLAPCDPTTCFAAGFLDVEQGKLDDSFKKFKKAAQLQSGFFERAVAVYMAKARRPDYAIAMAFGSINRLEDIIKILNACQLENKAQLIAQAKAEMQKLLEKECAAEQPKPSHLALLASLYREQEENQKAIELYRRALSLDYGQVAYRLQLAGILADIGHISEAIHEARLCLRPKPELQSAQKLIAELSVYPYATDADVKIPYSQTH